MAEIPNYAELLNLVTDLDNIEMIRITGISLLNRREKSDIDNEHRKLLNEALGEMVAMSLTYEANPTDDDDYDKIIDNIIKDAEKIIKSDNSIDVIHALCGVKIEQNVPLDKTDQWIAYV